MDVPADRHSVSLPLPLLVLSAVAAEVQKLLIQLASHSLPLPASQLRRTTSFEHLERTASETTISFSVAPALHAVHKI